MKLTIIIFLFIIVYLLDFRPVISKKSKRVTIFYCLAMLFSLTILVLNSMNINLPSPSLVIEQIILQAIGGNK